MESLYIYESYSPGWRLATAWEQIEICDNGADLWQNLELQFRPTLYHKKPPDLDATSLLIGLVDLCLEPSITTLRKEIQTRHRMLETYLLSLTYTESVAVASAIDYGLEAFSDRENESWRRSFIHLRLRKDEISSNIVKHNNGVYLNLRTREKTRWQWSLYPLSMINVLYPVIS